ncbi:unnamed protein product [Hermetia illucens]|uniref:BTB domain-containing protein n=1 Tax=Hermetia illucens TaxID=343691 RepID=A0A7R8Z2S1_HERIL|nr:protein tramtrack, beta isoform isoform X3 [Hermetia illucens]CAD7091157.1 unnamed protein product [Hermetia illucens]
MLPQQYCLRWRYHHSNLQTMFSQLLDRGCFCDVTLACEGQIIRAHRVVLCACSTYFDSMLTNYSIEKDTIIIMKDAKFSDVKYLIEFMYKGEINVEHENLASLLKTAEELKIKGLAEVSWREDDGEPPIPETEHNIPERIEQTPTINEEIVMPRMPVLTPIPSPNNADSHAVGVNPKRKRGRPPLDEEYDVYSTPQLPQIVENATTPSTQANDNVNALDSTQSPSMDESSQCEPSVSIHTDSRDKPEDWIKDELDADMDSPSDDIKEEEDSPDEHGSTSNFLLTPQEQEEWRDVVKMDTYLAKGRRPQFWEEPFTKRVMEAIKTKELEMKKAAQLLGVSYGTLYGRYRETYGCLKHPYRFKLPTRFRFGQPMMAELIN